MVRRFWERLDRGSQVALVTGVVLAVATIPLTAWLVILIGLIAAVALGFCFPGQATKVGILVAAPILSMGFLLGFVRGFGTIVLLVILAPSFILPVFLARLGAAARTGDSVEGNR